MIISSFFYFFSIYHLFLVMKNIEIILEKSMFASRWLMAPFYFGLIICLVFLLITFCNELIHFFSGGILFQETEMILFALTLIDLSFTGNLLLIVIFIQIIRNKASAHLDLFF